MTTLGPPRKGRPSPCPRTSREAPGGVRCPARPRSGSPPRPTKRRPRRRPHHARCRLTVRYDPPSRTSPARPTPLPPDDRGPLPPGPARPLTFVTTCWGGETMPEAAGPADPVLPDATTAQLEAEITHHVWLALLMAGAGHDGRSELAERHGPLFRLALLATARTGRERQAVLARVPRPAPP